MRGGEPGFNSLPEKRSHARGSVALVRGTAAPQARVRCHPVLAEVKHSPSLRSKPGTERSKHTVTLHTTLSRSPTIYGCPEGRALWDPPFWKRGT